MASGDFVGTKKPYLNERIVDENARETYANTPMPP